MGILLKDQKVLYADVNLGQIDVSPPAPPEYVDVTSVLVTPSEGSTAALSSDTGSTLQLVATVFPSTATIKSVTWSVNNPSLATISQSGLLTKVAPTIDSGSIVVTATASNGVSGNLWVEVYGNPSEVEVESVTVRTKTGESAAIAARETAALQLVATVLPQNASKRVTWSSSDTSLAVVDQTGLVLRAADIESEDGGSETVIITATANNGVSGQISVDVLFKPASETETFPADPWLRLEGSDLYAGGFVTSHLKTGKGVDFVCRSWPMRAGTNNLHMNGVATGDTASGTQLSAISTYGLVCPGSGYVNGATLNNSTIAFYPAGGFTMAMRFKYNANVLAANGRKWGPPGYDNLSVSQWVAHGADYIFCAYTENAPYEDGTPIIRVYIPARPSATDGGAVDGKVRRKIVVEKLKTNGYGWNEPLPSGATRTSEVWKFESSEFIISAGTNGSFIAEDIFLIVLYNRLDKKMSMYVNGVQVMDADIPNEYYHDWLNGAYVTVGAPSGTDWYYQNDQQLPFGGITSDDSATGCLAGEIGHVSVFNRVLTSSELAQLLAYSNQSVHTRGLSLASYAKVRQDLIEAASGVATLAVDDYLESFIASQQSVG